VETVLPQRRDLPLDENATMVRTYFTHGIEGIRTLLDPIRPMLAAFTRGENQYL